MLEGTVPALLTPFNEGGREIQLDLMDEHVSWLHEQGINAVSPLGTTGEGVSLALAERKAMIEHLLEHPAGMQLVPGTGCTNLPETIELSRFAVERGCAGILVAPTSYYKPTDHPGTTEYFAQLFEALPDTARVFLYHIVIQTGVPIEDETLRELGRRFGPMLAGVKDSSSDAEHVAAWVAGFPDLLIFNGSDAIAAGHYASGGRAVITAGANVHPAELEEIRRRVAAGEPTDALQDWLVRLRNITLSMPRQAALKHLLHLISGIRRSYVRPPLGELSPEQETELEREFAALQSEAHAR
jgi:4-hydroxy-tetrahydrodipicolinate synthase